MAKNCPLCGNQIKMFHNISLADGKICNDCARKIGILDSGHAIAEATTQVNMTIETAKNSYIDGIKIEPIEYNQHRKQVKQAQKQADKEKYAELKADFSKNANFRYGKLYFNDISKRLLIDKAIMEPARVYDYADITSVTPIITPTEIKKHHGITRGVVGGAIAGPAGAVVGAITGGKKYEAVGHLALNIHFKDGNTKTITFISTATKTNSFVYRSAYDSYVQVLTKLESIMNK